MALTVIVRTPGAPAGESGASGASGDGEDVRLTFDGTQRVIIGRGAGSDVRLPDASVSHRHASLRAQGADFAVVDEGSTNGTYVGKVRIAPHTSRLVKAGDMVRVGKVWLELRVDQGPATRDVAGATRDLALAIVSRALAAVGTDRNPRVRIVEGPDQGAVLVLAEAERVYVVGRAAHCDLAVADADSSREHLHVLRRGADVFVRDPGAKNGTWVGDARVIGQRDVVWRASDMIRVGRTVLALEEPVSDALAAMEEGPDVPLPEKGDFTEPPAPPAPAAPVPPPAGSTPSVAADPLEVPDAIAKAASPPASPAKPRWSVTDLVVFGVAASILALSLVGLVWLLKR